MVRECQTKYIKLSNFSDNFGMRSENVKQFIWNIRVNIVWAAWGKHVHAHTYVINTIKWPVSWSMFHVAKPRTSIGRWNRKFSVVNSTIFGMKYNVQYIKATFDYGAMVSVRSYESYLPIFCFSNINNNN